MEDKGEDPMRERRQPYHPSNFEIIKSEIARFFGGLRKPSKSEVAQAALGASVVAAPVAALHEPAPTHAQEAGVVAALPIEGGVFFTENGQDGYAVKGSMYEIFESRGGQGMWGRAISSEWKDEIGRINQAFEKGIFQVSPDGKIEFANIFDVLHEKGKDDWLENFRQTPSPFDWSSDRGKTWEEVVDAHLAILDQYLPLKQFILDNPDWLNMYGLPMSIKDYGPWISVRMQRANLQLLKENFPYGRAGDVLVANGGTVARESGVIISKGALELKNILEVAFEALLKNTQLVESIELPVVSVPGERRLEIRSSFDANYQIAINPEVRSQLLRVVAEDSTKHGVKEVILLELKSCAQGASVGMWVGKDGQSCVGGTGINLNYWRGIRDKADSRSAGFFGFHRVKDKIIFYHAPPRLDSFPLEDPIFQQAIGFTLTQEFLEMTAFGGDSTIKDNPFFRNPERINLLDNFALNFSFSGNK